MVCMVVCVARFDINNQIETLCVVGVEVGSVKVIDQIEAGDEWTQREVMCNLQGGGG